MLVFLFFNIRLVAYWLHKLKYLKPFKLYIMLTYQYSTTELRNIFAWSLLRYMVFTAQFCLLLQFWQVDVPIYTAVMLIAVVFLVMAAVPTFALTEIGVRGSVAVYFFSQYTSNDFGVLAAIFSLWVINIVIPAMIGSVFVMSAKVKFSAN